MRQTLLSFMFLIIFLGFSYAADFIHTYDYFHPNSILEVKQENNTRIYTFNLQKTKNTIALTNHRKITYDPFPLIFNDNLILLESIQVKLPYAFLTENLGWPYHHILTSLSISTGAVYFAREIIQPEIHAELLQYFESMNSYIRGVFTWRDKIVVLIAYNNNTRSDPENKRHPHVYLFDQTGKITASYNLEGFDFYGLGVDETTDRLIISDKHVLLYGSFATKEMAGLNPQILQMDLNTGEIVAKNDLSHSFFSPFDSKGFLYRMILSLETQDPSMPKKGMMECYSMNPFQKIWEKPLVDTFDYKLDKYWNGYLWSYYNDDSTGKPLKKYQAYDPQTLEPVETEENPYNFIHRVDGVSYRIEYIEEYSKDFAKRNVSIRITNLGADVENWPEH